LTIIYHVFGLRVSSEIPLPSIPVSTGAVDFDIRATSANLEQFGSLVFESDEGNVAVDGSRIWIELPNSCRSTISNDGQIMVRPNSGADCGAALVDTVLPIAMLTRGAHVLLHSSAVEIRGTAVGFLGPSGSGKSTTCLSLHQRGHNVLADDVLVIRSNAQTSCPVVLPGNPTFRLHDDSAGLVTEDLTQLESVEMKSGIKRLLPTPSGCREPLPLKALIVVTQGDELGMIRLKADQAFLEIIRNNAGLKLVHNLGQAESNFKICSRIAELIPVFKLTRSGSFSDLDQQVTMIEDCIGSLGEMETNPSEN
jgi:hypothetical protein